MEAVLYNLITQKKIVYGKNLLAKLRSVVTWNWFSLLGYSFNTELLERFLVVKGVNPPKTQYFVRYPGGSWGSLYSTPDRLFFTDNRLLWEVPYATLTKVSFIKKESVSSWIKQTHIGLAFNFENKIKRYEIMVPYSDVIKGEVDLSNRISTEQTEELFNLLRGKIKAALPNTDDLFS